MARSHSVRLSLPLSLSTCRWPSSDCSSTKPTKVSGERKQSRAEPVSSFASLFISTSGVKSEAVAERASPPSLAIAIAARSTFMRLTRRPTRADPPCNRSASTGNESIIVRLCIISTSAASGCHCEETTLRVSSSVVGSSRRRRRRH
eukprot:jgi/Chrpa1/19562/Chrysochromulina_OHIO_Genome00022511-RA